MTKLEQLINDLCPNGVEYKSLGELGYFYGGLSGKSKDDFKDGNAKFISYMNVYSNPALKVDTTETVRVGEDEKQNTIQYGDVLFTGSSETPDECGMSSVLTIETTEKLYLNSFCFGYRFYNPSQFLPGFLKHLFRSTSLRKQIGKTASGVTRFNVSKDKMKKVVIPIPPLPVQSEIVRILDYFAELSTELSTELSARQSQYKYYQQKLLSFDSETSYTTLQEVADIYDSLHQTPKYSEEGFSMIRVQDVKKGYIDTTNSLKVDEKTYETFVQKYKPKTNDIVVSRVGSYGNFAIIPDEFCCLGQNVAIIHPKMNAKFLYYILTSEKIKSWIDSNVKGASQKSFSLADLRRMPIPIVELDEQERIVAILDRFDTLCNDIFEGLPAEIEGRRKQYKYYRDRLLSF